MKTDKRNPYHWWLLVQQGLYTLLASAARLVLGRQPKPLVVLYGHQFSGNLKALYEQWQRHHYDNFDCYFLSLDPDYSQTLRQQGIAVLQCNNPSDMILAGRCDAMITDHGLHAMSLFTRLTDIIFIDVWHGIPFKGFVPDDFRLQHGYREVWVSSPRLKTLYHEKFGFPATILNSLGYARTDKLFRAEVPDNTIRQQASIPEGHRIVLYAPTWQQDDSGRELFPFGEAQTAFIEKLSTVCADNTATLVIRSHLNSSIGDSSLNTVRYCSMQDFPDSEALLQHTNVLICDWSSIAFDYLALDRPAIFLDVAPPFKNGFSLGPEYRFGNIATSMNELCDNLHKILADPAWYRSTQRDEHARVRSAVYGDNTDGQCAARQWSRLETLTSK